MATMQKLHAKATHVTLIGHFWESAMEYRHRGETWMGFRGHRFVVGFCAENAHATFPLSAQDSNYRRNCRRRRLMVSASCSWTRTFQQRMCVCWLLANAHKPSTLVEDTRRSANMVKGYSEHPTACTATEEGNTRSYFGRRANIFSGDARNCATIQAFSSGHNTHVWACG